MNELRLKVAQLAEDFYAGKISFDEFNDRLPEGVAEDEDTDELVDEIWQEPKVGGFLGVSEKYYAQYKGNIERLIRKLKEELPPAKLD